MSTIIRQMQIKTTLRYHRTPVRMAIVVVVVVVVVMIVVLVAIDKCWQGCREFASLVHY